MLEVGTGVGVGSSGAPPRMEQAESTKIRNVVNPVAFIYEKCRGINIYLKIITFNLK
jgi:hypothetical protein